MFQRVEEIGLEFVKNGKGAVLVGLDFSPNTKAENEPQAEVFLEHLFRHGVPVILFSLLPHSKPFLENLPKKVAARVIAQNALLGKPQEIVYGKNWVNLGYRPGTILFIQALAKSDNLSNFFKEDAYGSAVATLPLMRGINSISDLLGVGEFTGNAGVIDIYIQFLQRNGLTLPLFHGCTSITIPDGYIFLDSGQLTGLLEGVSGAAWYEELLRKNVPDSVRLSLSKGEGSSAMRINTALGVGQLLIILLIALGNLQFYLKRSRL
jgi:hypothetical protein